jgi:hypothetical protein
MIALRVSVKSRREFKEGPFLHFFFLPKVPGGCADKSYSQRFLASREIFECCEARTRRWPPPHWSASCSCYGGTHAAQDRSNNPCDSSLAM